MRIKKRGQGTAAEAVAPPGTDVRPEGFSLISDEKLMALYADLLKCRMIEERLASGRGRLGSASVRGYEAGTVGVAIDLGPEDAVCSPDRGLVTGFGNGAALDSLLLWSGAFLPLNGSHPARPGHRNGASSPEPGHAHIRAAIGAALVNKTRKNGKIAVVFGKDSESESWRETLHIATVHALPMIFVLREGSKPSGRRHASDPKQSAKPDTLWFPAITVDRDDVVAVYRVANEAISRARLGRGPTLIECRPFRPDTTSNGNGRHSHDPILNMENYLRGKGLLRPETKSTILKASTRELGAAMRAANGRAARPSR
jgi:2-oxoisovalerate dehydrogenase E1 component alpha subunit